MRLVGLVVKIECEEKKEKMTEGEHVGSRGRRVVDMVLETTTVASID
jgi:hypothetical protein